MDHEPRFQNRVEAGHLLAEALNCYAHCAEAIVLGLPRGGIPVAYAVSIALGIELDTYLVRKLGVPQYPELAIGAIAHDGLRHINPKVREKFQVDPDTLEQITQREWQELQRRNMLYRQGRPPLSLEGRIVIVVDDGIATGATMVVALESLMQQCPQKLVVAVPVAPVEAYAFLQTLVSEMICLKIPDPFHAVGEWYVDFSQTSDQEVCHLLAQNIELS